jgi:hypothetical protein
MSSKITLVVNGSAEELAKVINSLKTVLGDVFAGKTHDVIIASDDALDESKIILNPVGAGLSNGEPVFM